jgi:DHA1 family tetracycline resistance protein-like MFS transporter
MNGESRPAGGKSSLLFIFLTVFIDLLGFGIVIPLLPIYSIAFRASELELGLLFSCFSGMQFLFAPLWGRLSDRIGRRPVLIGGLLGTAASYVLFANATSLAMLYASRLLAGFFGANIAAAQAYIADVTPEKDRAKGMGLIGAAFGLGFTFGPLLGGLLSKHDPGAPRVALAPDLPTLPGYVAAGLSVAAAIFGLLKLREPPRHVAGARAFGFDQLRHAFADARIGTLLLLNFLNLFAFSCFEAMFTRYGLAVFPGAFDQPAAIEQATLEDRLNAAPIAGYYLFGIGIISALIQGGFIRRLVPKYGETRLAIAGPFLLGVAFIVIGSAPASAWWLVICGCLLMPFGFGLTNPAVNGLLSRAAPGDRQGAYLGMNQSAASLARVTGPPLAGALFAFTPRLPFFAAAGVLFVAAVVAVAYRARFGATFAHAPALEPSQVGGEA